MTAIFAALVCEQEYLSTVNIDGLFVQTLIVNLFLGLGRKIELFQFVTAVKIIENVGIVSNNLSDALDKCFFSNFTINREFTIIKQEISKMYIENVAKLMTLRRLDLEEQKNSGNSNIT